MAGKGRPFKKGMAPKSPGRPPISADVKALRKMNIQELNEVVSLLLATSVEDLKAMIKDDKLNVVQRMACSLALNTLTTGNSIGWNALLEQFRGKLKEKVEVSGDGLKPQVVLHFEDNGRKVQPK